MKGWIYKCTFPDGKVYIGQTRRPLRVRMAEHINPIYGPMNSGFWKAYQEFGSPKEEILEEIDCDSEDELICNLNYLETYYIEEYEATNPEHGYNIREAGHVPYKHLHVLREKCEMIRQELMEERIVQFDEILNKVLKDDPLSKEEKLFVEMYFLEDNPFLQSVEGIKEASKNNAFIYGEWRDFAMWIIDEECKYEASKIVMSQSEEILAEYFSKNAILQLDSAGNIVREYKSLTEVMQALNLDSTQNVKNVLDGKQKTAYGYKWIYKSEYKPSQQLSLF